MICRCARLQLGVQQKCRSRLQQRALKAALAGSRCKARYLPYSMHRHAPGSVSEQPCFRASAASPSLLEYTRS